MENIRYENDEFLTWHKTTEYNGPIGATLKFYVKEESAKEFKDMIIKNVRSEMAKNKCKSMKLNLDFKDTNSSNRSHDSILHWSKRYSGP